MAFEFLAGETPAVQSWGMAFEFLAGETPAVQGLESWIFFGLALVAEQAQLLIIEEVSGFLFMVGMFFG